jgi:Trk-type K+ transport system membrane component
MGAFFFFWIGIFVLITVVLLHKVPAQHGLADVLFEAASALGTV